MPQHCLIDEFGEEAFIRVHGAIGDTQLLDAIGSLALAALSVEEIDRAGTAAFVATEELFLHAPLVADILCDDVIARPLPNEVTRNAETRSWPDDERTHRLHCFE